MRPSASSTRSLRASQLARAATRGSSSSGSARGDAAEKAIIEFVDFDFAQRRAEKKAADKAVVKKETLLDKARRLVTGKGSADKEAVKTDESTEAAGEKKAVKKAAPKMTKPAKDSAPKAQKTPRAKVEKKGGSTTRTPRKAGGG